MADAHCYCGTQEIDEYTMLQCQQCKLFFHAECLKRGRPSPLEGDVLFDFACSGCSEDGFERCFRLKLQWQVIGLQYEQPTLVGVMLSCLRCSTCSCKAVANAAIFAGGNTFAISSIRIGPHFSASAEEATAGTGNRGNRKALSTSRSSTDLNAPLIKEAPTLHQSDFKSTPTLLDSLSQDLKPKLENVSQDEKSVSQLLGTDDEDDDAMDINPGSISPVMPASPSVEALLTDAFIKDGEVKQESKEGEDETGGHLDSDYDIGAASSKGVKRMCRHSVDDSDKREQDNAIKPLELVGIAVYEEKRLLRLLEKSQCGTHHDAVARRLRRKLIVRQQKRERSLPLFDLNSFLRGDPRQSRWATQNPTTSEPSEFRILDRYRARSKCRTSANCNSTPFLMKLVGSCANEPDDIVSPYTTRILKPFIWRDYESQPPKWCILKDIAANRSKHDETWVSPPMAPIDYRYVRPQYIPAINSLCREFFWPGIDLSDSLHYPDFSCVALYRKVVVGFAFMVPDVKYNEAYISFVFTHPEWRGAGIATFMIYHLIQTCMGKDVTLHVSATNPALLLYQKFGFKVEEFVVDFYDKYFPIESKECKHAMFLRLSR